MPPIIFFRPRTPLYRQVHSAAAEARLDVHILPHHLRCSGIIKHAPLFAGNASYILGLVLPC